MFRKPSVNGNNTPRYRTNISITRPRVTIALSTPQSHLRPVSSSLIIHRQLSSSPGNMPKNSKAATIGEHLKRVERELGVSNSVWFDIDTDTLINSFSNLRPKSPLSLEVFAFATKAIKEFKTRELHIEKLSMDDSWQHIYRHGKMSLEIIQTDLGEKLAQQGKNLLHWVKDISDSSNPSFAIDRVVDIERCQGRGHGDIQNTIDNWWYQLSALGDRARFKQPESHTEMAIHNLSMIADKLTRDILNYRMQSSSPSNRR